LKRKWQPSLTGLAAGAAIGGEGAELGIMVPRLAAGAAVVMRSVGACPAKAGLKLGVLSLASSTTGGLKLLRLPESQSTCMGDVRDGIVLLSMSRGEKAEEPQSVPSVGKGAGAVPKALEGVFPRGTCRDCRMDVESPPTCPSVGPPTIGGGPPGALLHLDFDSASLALGGTTTLGGIDPAHGRLCAVGSCCADICGIPRDDAPRPAKF